MEHCVILWAGLEWGMGWRPLLLESMKKDGVLLPASYEFTDTHQSQETGLIRTVLMPACAGIQFSPAWTQRRAFPSDAESGCAKLRLILLKLLYWKMPNL